MKVFYYRLLLLMITITAGVASYGQVKIGGQKGSAPHPSAVLELSDSAKGFLMPRVTLDQMKAIKSPANGLLVYNTSDDKLYVYRQSLKEWKEIIMAPLPAANMLPAGDTSEWVYDADSARVYLRRGVMANDTIFYSPTTGRMVFADKHIYGNSLGQDFQVDLLGGKFNFKATSSMMGEDPNRQTIYTNAIVKEVDASSSSGDFQSGLLVATTVNPKNTQVTGEAQGANISTIHAGQDTLFALAGLDNTATVNGNGYTEEMWGINNTARISGNSRNNILNMYGIRNNIIRSAAATGRINGNVYGYISNLSGLSDKVDGTMYGIFLGNVINGTTRRNYGIFTNKGLNRFGDSVLVTDNFVSQPRAVFDINSTSAMVIPSGSTAQRPTTNVQGMFRYNNTTGTPEYNNGASWLSLGSGGGEWDFNSVLNRVQLTRALGVNDTTFYSPVNRHFLFTDRLTYTNSQGLDFQSDLLGGKFTFKATASLTSDTTEGSLYTTGVIKEIDNTGLNDQAHSGMLIATTINPKATQVTGQAQGLNVSAIHAGQDTARILSGIDNTATVNGNGYAEEVWGMSNAARISSNSRNDIGSMYGFRNTLSRSAAATGRINGNVYGYFGNMAGLSDKVDGTIYGIFLGNIQNGTTRRNYGIFTSKGLNRFGDSVLVTDNFVSQPRAVFDINSTSAMVLPNGSTAQRPATNVQGMFRYNNTTNTPEYNNGASWLSLGSGGGEWDFNSVLNRVQLTRALGVNDTTFYSPVNRHFLFTDRLTYTNSQGLDFQSDLLGGKFTFKATASLTSDTTEGSLYTTGVIKEIDNTGLNDQAHSGMLIATTINPKATQVTGQAQGLNVSAIHAGQDTARILSGIDNTATVNGNGYAEEVWGMSNAARISSNSRNDIGSMYGFRNTLSRSAAATGRINGNVYGYFGNMAGLSDKVDGTIYGIFLGNIQNGTTRRNYGIFTSKGLNRFGDSVLVTDNFVSQPRAVFDINSTSAMVLPSGSTAQRPTTNVQGMFRYNNTTNTPEYNNGTNWLSLASGSSEWDFNSALNRVQLTRALGLNDTTFYSTTSRHFLFTDRLTYTNSQGLDFQSDLLGGKFTFKATASRTTDTADASIYTSSVIKEIDNTATDGDFQSGMLVATTVNPKATQVVGQAQGINISSIHAGQDTAYAVSGIDNTATVNGNGYAEELYGVSNITRMNTNSRNNVGTMYGIRNTLSRSPSATGRINNNAYGYWLSMSGLSDKVDGTMYGIYINGIVNGTTRRNYAIYTNQGLNRFGDSVLVTNVGAAQPRAIFDINATSAMVLPNGTTAQRPATNVQGMLRYNSTTNYPEYNNGTTWVGISTDEWVFGANNRVSLSRALPVGDSIFYSTTNRHFIFGDRSIYTNSLGQDFSAEQLGGKFTFKSTASKMPDSASTAVYTASIINEVDNASNTFNDAHSGLLVAATINPKSTQTSSQVQGMNVSSIHAGQNTVSNVSGIDNVTTINGLGYADQVNGFTNLTRMSTNSRNNVGAMAGITNTLTRSASATGRITGDVYGYQGNFSGLSGRVDGTIYGIYLNTVQNASTRRNYAVYTNGGLNRFGDSVVITNNGSTQPRAVLDVRSTSSMIVPVGTTAQRPTGIAGMVRYNTDNGGTLETFNGTSWNGIIRNTQNIDVPNISANSSVTISITVSGATVGSVVYVSPSAALPATVVIAYARVTAANTVEIKFNNVSAPAINPAAMDYNIRVIQ